MFSIKIRMAAHATTFACVLMAGLALGGKVLQADDHQRPQVVATFSILADMTRAIAGDRIELTVLVGPDGDTHLFDPRPSHARAVAAADLLIANGLGFETFLPGLVDATGYSGPIVSASDGVVPRPLAFDAHGDDAADEEATAAVPGAPVDPHAWQDLTNAAIYVRNIAAGLAAVDPDNAAVYNRNAARYAAEIRALDADIRARFAALPDDRRRIITNHDAFGYFGAAYGLAFEGVTGVSTAAEPSAGEVAALVAEIREEGVRALFIESPVNPALIEQIARETGARVGGKLYPDALTGESGPAPTFLDMMRHNAATIGGALLDG